MNKTRLSCWQPASTVFSLLVYPGLAEYAQSTLETVSTRTTTAIGRVLSLPKCRNSRDRTLLITSKIAVAGGAWFQHAAFVDLKNIPVTSSFMFEHRFGGS